MLANVSVKVEIQKGMDARAKRTEITSDRILKEMARSAFFNPKYIYDENGDFRPLDELPDEVACAIKAVRIDEVLNKEGRVVSRKYDYGFVDKRQSLDSLARAQGLFKDRVAHSGDLDGSPIEIRNVFVGVDSGQ